MSKKVTKKEINSRFNKIVKVGYCRLQSLLSCESPIGHTERIEGWGADIYYIDGVAITTGYAPFGNIAANYDICEKYETKAQKILCDRRITKYDTKASKLYDLVCEFVEEVTA